MADSPELAALLERAAEAARNKDLPRAGELLAQALELDPEHVRALDLLGFVRYFEGRYDESEACCRKALAILPDHPYALNGLGNSLARQQRIDEALPAFERAMTLGPRWFDPYWDMALALDRAGRSTEALEVLERGEREVPDPAKRKRLAKLADKIRARNGEDC